MAGEVQTAQRHRDQRIRVRDQGRRAHLGTRPGSQDPRRPVDRPERREAHRRRMDRPAGSPSRTSASAPWTTATTCSAASSGPTWDETPLHSLSTEEITRWENALPARTGVSPRTARAARTLLGTILGDAATTRPPLIPYNPALRPRNRGRRTGRRLQLTPQRAWATPLETLLLAERAALMTGRDEDFTMILTIGYTGLRWGEAIGLERGYPTPARSTSSGSSANSTAGSTGSRPRTTPTAARPGSRVSR